MANDPAQPQRNVLIATRVFSCEFVGTPAASCPELLGEQAYCTREEGERAELGGVLVYCWHRIVGLRQVSSVKCQVSSVKCQVSSVKCQVPSAKCQVSSAKC